jgi:Ca2+-binding RTX toxin-like protein
MRAMKPGKRNSLVLAVLAAAALCVAAAGPAEGAPGGTATTSTHSQLAGPGSASADIVVNTLHLSGGDVSSQVYVSIDPATSEQVFYSPQGIQNPGGTCTPDSANQFRCSQNTFAGVYGSLGAGADLFHAASNVHILIGFETTSGFKYLNGAKGKDTIVSGAGADFLKGGPSNDKLKAGRGRDHLDGGSGSHDYCKGGAGTDLFKNCESGSQ